jgi:hypothetical protein
MAKLLGIADAKISTPHGLITLSRNGEAVLDADKAAFIKTRIEAGSLPDYSLIDDEPLVPDKPPKTKKDTGGDEK